MRLGVSDPEEILNWFHRGELEASSARETAPGSGLTSSSLLFDWNKGVDRMLSARAENAFLPDSLRGEVMKASNLWLRKEISHCCILETLISSAYYSAHSWSSFQFVKGQSGPVWTRTSRHLSVCRSLKSMLSYLSGTERGRVIHQLFTKRDKTELNDGVRIQNMMDPLPWLVGRWIHITDKNEPDFNFLWSGCVCEAPSMEGVAISVTSRAEIRAHHPHCVFKSTNYRHLITRLSGRVTLSLMERGGGERGTVTQVVN